MNPVINVDGDTATALSNWGYVTRDAKDAPSFEMLGHYVDDLVKTADGWKFSRREAYSDVPYISSTASSSPPASTTAPDTAPADGVRGRRRRTGRRRGARGRWGARTWSPRRQDRRR